MSQLEIVQHWRAAVAKEQEVFVEWFLIRNSGDEAERLSKQLKQLQTQTQAWFARMQNHVQLSAAA